MNRQFSLLLHLFIVLASLLASCSTVSTPQPPTPTPMPSGMVEVGGHELYYECSGQGTPTVILESGGGGDSSAWAAVKLGLAGTTRICAYDRANLGRSDKVPGPRTYHDMTQDLRVLLEKAHIGEPYILVGHSMGGMLVRIFADQHPGEVAGIVLVDSAHPDMGLHLLACLPPESADEPENIRYLRQWFTWMSDSSHEPPFVDNEVLDTLVGNRQVRDVESLGDLPLVVISQAPNIPGLGYQIVASSEIDACLRQTWQDMQGELAGLSSKTSRLTAQGGHMIPLEQPELIVQAITHLVEQER
jgi:pimeloyl-ACP methyl ester carboxylesterase